MLKISIFPVGLTAGLLMFVFLTIGFRFTGYTMPLSICLGVLGGTACGLVLTWWNTEEETPIEADEIASETAEENLPKLPPSELEKTQTPQKVQLPYRSTNRSLTILAWMFRKKR